MATLLLLYILTFSFLTDIVKGRILKLYNNVSDNLISDGVDPIQPVLSSSSCVHKYGFFPCADNIGGYVFQIVVYQYLLVLGGKLVSKGSKALFNIIGTGVYGASVFRVLTVLPKMVTVIVTGVLHSKETAQVSVSSGVATYAGSTVFNLTVLWGMCVIFGREELPTKSDNAGSPTSNGSMFAKKLSRFKDTGAEIDQKTCYTAGIMLLSLIPYFIVQLNYAVNSNFGTRIVILIALIVSTALLLSYFLYQIFDPWIQERSLEYSKYEHLLAGFLHHVQRHAKEKLVDENGEPNISVIKGLFHEIDKDADKIITFHELENLIQEIQSGKAQVEKEYAITEMLKAFDQNRDGKIEEHEFGKGYKKLIAEARQLAKSGDSIARNFIREVVDPLPKKRRYEIPEIEHVMARFLKHAENQELEGEHLVADDGRPNLERIKALFKQFDTDQSNSLSQLELEQLIQSTIGDCKLNHRELAENFIKEFDQDDDNIVDEQEFTDGMIKWLKKAMDVTKCKDRRKSIEEYDKIMWAQVDNLVYEVGQSENSKFKFLTWGFSKSTFQVILGIAILTFLSGPLMASIQQFSDAIGVPSFFISFVIVPVAMNARSAILAIFPASQKSSRTSSLTFSEIYGCVVTNNMMGLSTLLVIVYVKGLDWNYSAEVLTILVVCAIIGLLAYSQTTYRLWTCLLAFSLYPFSLVMYYALQYVWGWD